MSPKLIDIHSHVNFNAFKEDGPEVLKHTLEGNIWTILVGSQIDTSRRAVEYAAQYPKGIYAAVGLHPIHLVEMQVDKEELNAGENVSGFKTRVERYDYDAYRKLADHPKTVAIGECGLDYYRVPNLASGMPSGIPEAIKQLQADTFQQQVALAREVKKPLMIHCRNAYEDLLQILREENARDIGGNIHFFAGSWDIAKQFLDLGFYLSFTGVLTFTHDYDEVVEKAPLDRVMVETDAPYVSPVPFRGKRNEPLYVEHTARRISEIKKLPEDQVFEQLVENTKRCFRI